MATLSPAMYTGYNADAAFATPPEETFLSRDMRRALEDAILAELIHKQQQARPQQQSLLQRRQQQTTPERMNLFPQPPQSLFGLEQQQPWKVRQSHPCEMFAGLFPPPGLAAAWPHGMPTRPPPGLPTPPHLAALLAPAKLLSAPCGTPDTASTAYSSEESPSLSTTPLSGPDVAPNVPDLQLEGDVPPPPTPADACTPECPSVGSMGHHLGVCTPCDFVNRGFCRSGAECRFCHLCGPAERKLRKLQRRKMVRAMARQEAAQSEM